jgi:penicillin-binding protein 1C
VFYFIIPPQTPLFQVDYSTTVLDENGKPLRYFLNNQDQWLLPPDTSNIPEKLKQSVIQFEDEAFHSHPGINPLAVIKALYRNITRGEIISGASTITMQVARMRNPKSRTYFNKMLEMLDALKLEIHYSKEEILRLYLQHAPYGSNIMGYKAASLKYFGKNPDQLTWSEAATLAVLPNAPGLIFPTRSDPLLAKKRDLLLKKLYDNALIPDQTYRLALLEPIPDQFLTFSQDAPHLTQSLKLAHPTQDIIRTTLNKQTQQKVQVATRKHQEQLNRFGIENTAVLVADTRTGAIKAYMGSADYFDKKAQGMVDGVQSARSSGSVLKPFLYALSMDDGLIVPQSYIRDLPTYFDGFAPNNASETFQGVATAKEALVNSLNVAAVRLLNAYGVFQFYNFLKEAGVSSLFRSADEYGLPLILGGAEVTVWDMTTLYRGLANKGFFVPLHILQADSLQESKGIKLISEGAAHLTLEMLKDLKRPGNEFYWQNFSGQQSIAWKTGTSFGHKDAWAIGVTPEYTIAVWAGNFDGSTNKNLGGAVSAGPLMFDLFQVLGANTTQNWFEKDEKAFTKQTLCALSGFVATEACPETISRDVPAHMKALRKCSYHKIQYFSDNGKYTTCSKCWNTLGAHKKAVTFYPPDIAYYLRENGQYITPIPGHYPKCEAYTSEKALKIIYPNLDAKLFLPRDFDGELQEVICKVGNSRQQSTVYWYLNESYVGETHQNHKLAIQFADGWNTLMVIDDKGSSDVHKVFAQHRN